MAEVQGTWDEAFQGVADAFAANFASGEDVGACAAVFVEGELVVDIWGGVTDVETQAPWQRDTLINVWSTTKTMCNLSALVLADRGELDLHAPVATYWPEFAANGKEGITTAHFLGHTSGLSGFEGEVTEELLFDWDAATARLAGQAPWWDDRSRSGYHAITQGYLVGEVVRRITGSSLGAFFAKEIAGPLGADFHIGTGPECDDRVALVIPPPAGFGADLAPDPGSVAAKTAGSGMNANVAWSVPWRRAEIPAANGHGNARSVAAVQSVVSNGGSARGVELLSAKGIEQIFEVQAYGTDQVLGVPMKMGTGYGLPSAEVPISPSERACFWGGWGGSIVVNDLDSKLTVAYVMNRMGEGTTGDLRGAAIAYAAYDGAAKAS